MWVRVKKSLDWRFIWATVAIILVICVNSAYEDHRSCVRTAQTRKDLNVVLTDAMQRRALDARDHPQNAAADAAAILQIHSRVVAIPNCSTIPAGE